MVKMPWPRGKCSFVEHRQNFFGLIAQRTQQNSRWQLAATVNSDEYQVLGIELKIQPGTTVGNHPG